MFLQVNLNCHHVCSIFLNVKPVRYMLWNTLQKKREIIYYPSSVDPYCINPLDSYPSPSPPPLTFSSLLWRTNSPFVGTSALPIRIWFRFRRPLPSQLPPSRPSPPQQLSSPLPNFPLWSGGLTLGEAHVRPDLSDCDVKNIDDYTIFSASKTLHTWIGIQSAPSLPPST